MRRVRATYESFLGKRRRKGRGDRPLKGKTAYSKNIREKNNTQRIKKKRDIGGCKGLVYLGGRHIPEFDIGCRIRS